MQQFNGIAFAVSAVVLSCALQFRPAEPRISSAKPSPHPAAIQRRSSPATISLKWLVDSDHQIPTVVLTGLSRSEIAILAGLNWNASAWQLIFSVHIETAEAQAGPQPPGMSGTVHFDSDVVRFSPAFPLDRGTTYRATFRPQAIATRIHRLRGVHPVTASFTMPARPPTSVARIENIFPSSDTLPANLLKFYVVFSTPMNRGGVYDHIKLFDGDGKEVDLPFLEIDEELWNPQLTRLTLIIDPGRIKRGVLPLEEIGAALEAGKTYRLSVRHGLSDSQGARITTDFDKVFRVSAADRTPPDPNTWRIEAPRAGTRDPLRLDFTKPMDYAVSQRLIVVTDSYGRLIEGDVALTERERVWTFRPANSWPTGAFNVVIQSTVEDLAGNNIGKAFDVDVFEGVDRKLSSRSVKLPFTIR